MNYGRVAATKSVPSVSDNPFENSPDRQERDGSQSQRRRRLVLLAAFAAVLFAASAASVLFLLQARFREAGGNTAPLREPTVAISRVCAHTPHLGLCLSSLLQFPGAAHAGESDLVHVSVNMTLQRLSKALYGVSAISNVRMETRLRTAYEDCLELLDDSVDLLSRSLAAMAPGKVASAGGFGADVLTWLSGALTNQDTCTEGLEGAPGGFVKDQMTVHLGDLTELVSNTLAIFAVSIKNREFSGVPIQNKRRKLLSSSSGEIINHHFPIWLKKKDRMLLQTPASSIRADFVVSKDGNGTHKTIEQAVKAAPEYSPRRIIIYVKAGWYYENIKVGRKKTNLMFVGDGKSNTIVAGFRSVLDNYTTFHTATFAATGSGFIVRDITFQNGAGPEKHQAVALRIGADHAVVYRCNVIAYQDSLYVHSQRQFFRECDIYGTVDFIFGNAAVVLQNCSIYARKPMDMQKNTVTAQNRKDANQNTGISIHACRILPTPDLDAANASSFQTYLGRPWKLYSRTVVMMSYIADHVHPAGWLEWNATFALDTLYYGEYMNYGPGAEIGKRVTWPGYHIMNSSEEASKFTVAQFIYGSSWLPSTGVAFLAGLST